MEILAFLVMFLILIVYLRKTNALSAKVSELEREMHGLRHAVSSSTPAAMPPPLTATPESKVESAIPPSRVAPTPLISSKPLFSPSHTRAEWEALIGGKLLNRIGALALIIGIGFFLKYAFDRNWISETIRVLIGFLVGAGLLAGGSRTHKKGFQIFAQGINGAGIAILYLSVYASFNFYHLVSQPVAFIMMSTVTALTFLQALKYDSLAVSLLGWAGGFLTPFMLNTGQSNEVGLFSYIVLLDIGLLAILLKKDLWIILEPFTLAATYLIYFFWYDEYYTDDKLLVTVLFLTIFWGLFYALDLHRIVKSSQRFGQVRQADAVFNAVFYYAAMYAIINPSHHQWMSIVTLIIGAVYFLTGLALKERRMEARAALARYTLTAIVLLIFATEIQFTGFKTAIFWSLEALILLWCGIHWKLRYVWQAGLGLMGLALLRLLGTEGALAYSPIENF
ncbi:MAG: DUF2339 domain-containing protein, partial [candidate division KSB1 bacterium]|nr:DUF2339 domain-containing protein [candidate division KSB1 bacterium]